MPDEEALVAVNRAVPLAMAAAYRQALDLTANEAERAFLTARPGAAPLS